MPSCFHHAALPQTGSRHGAGPSKGFLQGGGLPPSCRWDGTVISRGQGVWRVRWLLLLGNGLSSRSAPTSCHRSVVGSTGLSQSSGSPGEGYPSPENFLPAVWLVCMAVKEGGCCYTDRVVWVCSQWWPPQWDSREHWKPKSSGQQRALVSALSGKNVLWAHPHERFPCVGGVSVVWEGGGWVMNTSRQQCARCGSCGVSLEFQPGFPFGFHSCRPPQLSGRCGGVPGTHRRLNPEEYAQWGDRERTGQETPHSSSGWWRRRWTKEVICSSLSKKNVENCS